MGSVERGFLHLRIRGRQQRIKRLERGFFGGKVKYGFRPWNSGESIWKASTKRGSTYRGYRGHGLRIRGEVDQRNLRGLPEISPPG